jgi:myo-inositol-1(or 4)-monophosphatase
VTAAHKALDRELALAQRLADAARTIARRYFRRPLAVEHKQDRSPVTVADREIETELRRLIRAEFPAHSVFGEEFGRDAPAEFTWVLDPIDGTKSFVSGLPLFGTLIALVREQTPLLGVIEIPPSGERWVGRVGAGSTLNEGAARASECTRIEEARLYATSPDDFDSESWRRIGRLSRLAAVRRFGGDCYVYGLLASGYCDLVVETGLQPYDYLALVRVVEGAGGKISDWHGAPLGLQSDGRVIAAASESLWHQALERLAST